jgi:hypothetical protein
VGPEAENPGGQWGARKARGERAEGEQGWTEAAQPPAQSILFRLRSQDPPLPRLVDLRSPSSLFIAFRAVRPHVWITWCAMPHDLTSRIRHPFAQVRLVSQLLTRHLFTLMLLMPQGSEGWRKDVASGGGTRGVGCRMHVERAFSPSAVAWGAKDPALSRALTPLGSPLRHDAASEHVWLQTLVSVGAWLLRVHVASARAYAPFFALLISLVMSCVNLLQYVLRAWWRGEGQIAAHFAMVYILEIAHAL